MKILRKVAVFSLLLLFSCQKNTELLPDKENLVEKGERFHVRLPEDHSKVDNGYWYFDSNNSSIIPDGYYGSTFRGNEKGVDFNFVATKQGVYTLYFYKKSHKDTLDLKSFIIKIRAN